MSVLSAAAIDDETTVAGVAMATPIETTPFAEQLQADNDDSDESAPFVPHVAEGESVVKATEKEKTRESTTFVVKRMALAMTLPALAEDESDFAVPVAMETTTATAMTTTEEVVVKETEKKTKEKKKKRVVVEAGGQSDFDLITNLLGGASDLVDVDDRADAYVFFVSLFLSLYLYLFF
jgi:hypothetical protein